MQLKRFTSELLYANNYKFMENFKKDLKECNRIGQEMKQFTSYFIFRPLSLQYIRFELT